MTDKFDNKKNSLLSLLEYIDKENFWPTAKYLISYINNTDGITEEFIDLVSDLIVGAIHNAKDIIEKKKLEKISSFMENMKNNEINDNEQDKEDIENLFNDLDDI